MNWPSRDIARIRHHGGELLMPADSPYQQETVFEHAEQRAKRYGAVRLTIGKVEWFLQPGRPLTHEQCARCCLPLAALLYHIHNRPLCRRCARAMTNPRTAHTVRPLAHPVPAA